MRGFTLIEMLVAVALFAVVMIISVGALLSLVTANRKAQALQSVMNNLSVTVDSMVRSIRQGTSYDCPAGGGPSAVSPNVTHDCSSGNTEIGFESQGGLSTPTNPVSDQRVYAYLPSGSCGPGYAGGCIERSYASGAPGTWVIITAPEVAIDDMKFYAVGTTQSDSIQPKVVIVIKGTAGGVNTKITSTFHIQATAVQRVLDI